MKNYELNKKIFSILIILLPFLYQYKGISYISLGELLLLPFMSYFFINDKKLKVCRKEWLFYSYVIFSTFICMVFSYFNILDAMTVIVRMFFYAILIKEANDYFSWKKVEKIYTILVILLSTYLLIQFFYYKKTGNYLPIYINYNFIFTPEQRAKDLIEYYKWNFRPSSLFLEPSYYALYCIPFLCFEIFRSDKKIKDCIFLLLVISSVFISGAGSGIMVILLLVCYFFFIKLKRIGVYSKITSLIILILIIFIIICFLSLNLEGTSLHRLQTGGSINQRITRGIIIFKELTLFHKIFGVGINNIENYMIQNRINTPFDEANLNYMCSILQVLNCFGVIGIIFFINYIYSIWKKINKIIILKSLFFMMIFVMSYEGILFTYRFAFLFIILNSDIKFYNN